MLSQALRSFGLITASMLFTIFVAAPAWAERTNPTEPPGAASVVCTQTRGSMNCHTTWGSGGGMPLVVRVVPPEQERDRASWAERIRAWEAYCRPSLRYDRYGVGRYVYRVAGCEFGRSAD